MSEQKTRASRRFEAETVGEIRHKLGQDEFPLGLRSAHSALRLLLRSHDKLVAALQTIANDNSLPINGDIRVLARHVLAKIAAP